MTHYPEMDRTFERLLPSASQQQMESARSRILERIRVAAAVDSRGLDAAGERVVALNHAHYHILLVLEHGERHGYAIMSEVSEITEGATQFGPGTFYSSINTLLTAGWIEESHVRPDPALNDEHRQFYRLTGTGRRFLVAESERLAEQERFARNPHIVKSI